MRCLVKKGVLLGMIFIVIVLPCYFWGRNLFFCKMKLRNIDKQVEAPGYFLNGKLYIEDKKVHVSQICREKNDNYNLEDVLCVDNNEIYFIVSDYEKDEVTWAISCINTETMEFQICYEFENVKETYRQNHVSEYMKRNGYYFDGDIVLNDFKTVLTYNIDSGDVNEYVYGEYQFPSRTMFGECVTGQEIKIHTETETRIFSLQQIAKTNSEIEKLYLLDEKKTWNKTLCLQYFFSENSIQIVGDKIYAVGSVLSYSGQAYAVILNYDYTSDSWKYVSHYFASDNVHSRSYVIYN